MRVFPSGAVGTSVIHRIAPVWSASHFNSMERPPPHPLGAFREDHTGPLWIATTPARRLPNHHRDQPDVPAHTHLRAHTSRFSNLNKACLSLKWLNCHFKSSGHRDYRHGRNYIFSFMSVAISSPRPDLKWLASSALDITISEEFKPSPRRRE